MKTIPPSCLEPETGPKYWRSLDQLAATPEFRQWAQREFPAGASQWDDPVSRRHFVKIMSASFLLAGLGSIGCRRPVENIYPFTKMPQEYVHGVPQYFATAMPTRNTYNSTLGYMSNRLSAAENIVNVQAQNLQAAVSGITDVDTATETSNLTRNSVLTQAGIAMLAQANTMPQMALKLLQ